MFDGNTVPLIVIAVTIIASPFLVAMTGYKTAKILPGEKLTTRLIMHYWMYWLWAIAANVCLLAVELHEFTPLSGVVYMFSAAASAILGLCVLIVASSEPD